MVLVLFAHSLGAAEKDFATAKAEYEKGNFDAALAALERVEPSAEALDLRGCIYLEQRKFDDARKAFDASHAAKPELFAPRLHAADALMREKKFAEARDVYRVLLKETNALSSNERLRFAILLSYLGEHNETEARAALDAVTFPTQSATYYFAQAAWLFSHNKPIEAEAWLRKIDKLYSAEARAWFAQHLYQFGWLKSKPPLSTSLS